MSKMCVSNYTLCFIGKNLECFYKVKQFFIKCNRIVLNLDYIEGYMQRVKLKFKRRL